MSLVAEIMCLSPGFSASHNDFGQVVHNRPVNAVAQEKNGTLHLLPDTIRTDICENSPIKFKSNV